MYIYKMILSFLVALPLNMRTFPYSFLVGTFMARTSWPASAGAAGHAPVRYPLRGLRSPTSWRRRGMHHEASDEWLVVINSD